VKGVAAESAIQPTQSGFQVRIAGAKVIDSNHGKYASFGFNPLVRIDQKRDVKPLENRLDAIQSPIPVLMIPQRGKSAESSLDPGQLLDAARKEHHGIRDVVTGQNEEVRLELDDLVDVAPQLCSGHVQAGMDVSDLDHPERNAEGQSELTDVTGPGGIGSPIAGDQEGCRGETAQPGLDEAAATKIHRLRERPTQEAPIESHGQSPNPPATCARHRSRAARIDPKPHTAGR